MNKECILVEIEQVKTNSKATQSNLLNELKLLESQDKSAQNRKRMGEITIAHSKDLWNTSIKIFELESKLNFL